MAQTMDINNLARELEALADSGVQDSSSRERLLKAAQRVVAELEDPRDAIERTVYAPFEIMGARLGNDLNIFGLLSDNSKPISTEKLAAITGADEHVLERILRHLATMDMIKQASASTWAPSRLTKALSENAPGIFHHTESTGPAILALPSYLERNKYRTPEDVRDTAFTHVHKEAPTLYEWFATRPKHLEMFHRWMVSRPYRAGHWLDVFPFEKLVARPTDTPETVIFVDVGGGRGHQCLEIRNRFPNVKGRLILEDTESVIAGAVQVPNMDVVEVDFMKGQPIKGARTYYLRSILHNWPTPSCLQILRHIKSAMSPSSLLLIDDMVMPETGADKVAVSMDIAMMAAFTSEERTLKRWRELFDEVGMEVEGVYVYDERAHSSVLAVRLK